MTRLYLIPRVDPKPLPGRVVVLALVVVDVEAQQNFHDLLDSSFGRER